MITPRPFIRGAALLAIGILSVWPLAPALAKELVPRVPAYDHIVVVIMENRDFKSIIGNALEAPYLNTLADKGTLLTNYTAITHPSEPNYFALYAGRTFGVIDDEDYVLHGPTLATILRKAGKTFTGYVEHPNSTDSHNPWTPFPEGEDVEQDFAAFPTTDFSKLPTVAFVIPNVDHDMHDGTIADGDTWLKANLDSYAQWAKANNSLLIVTWDEDDDGKRNHVATIFHGAHVKRAHVSKAANHYNLLSTMLAAYELTGPANAATAPIIDIFGLHGPARQNKAPAIRGPHTPRVAHKD